jgi:soluble lytic murein transglycosylase-like protein
MARILSALLIQFGVTLGGATMPRVVLASEPSVSQPETPAAGSGHSAVGLAIMPRAWQALEGLEPDVPALIVDAAIRWGLSPERMLRVAWCESRWDPDARGTGGHQGVFQFAPRTWAWASTNVGLEGASPFDPEANVEAASWLMATQGPSHWGCR